MMRRLFSLLVSGTLLASGLAGVPALADERGDQASARKELRAGNVMKLREIERIVVPQIERQDAQVEYLTSEWDEVARAYRMKFIDNARDRMIWVDVDARNAKILRIRK